MLLCKEVQLKRTTVSRAYRGVEFSFLGVESCDLNATLNYLGSITCSQNQTQKHKILSTAQAIQN